MNSKHEHYLRQAEEAFSNASGDYYDDYGIEGGVDVNPEAFAADGLGEKWGNAYGVGEMMDHYATGNPVPAKKIPDFDRTYTVTVDNANAATTPVTIFGANQLLLAANFGNPAGITVTVGESSYVEALQESQESPFVVSGFRITSANAAQLDQVLTIRKRTGNGQNCSYPLQVANYFSAFQFQAGIREIYPYHIEFAGTTSISFDVLATTTVVFTFFVGRRVDPANVLTNNPSREFNRTSLPFQHKQEVVLTGAAARAIEQG